MKGWNKIVVVFAVLLAALLCKNLLAGQVGQPSPVDNINAPDSPGIRNGAMASGDACPIRNGVMTSGDACPTKEAFTSKTRTLHMPFIANNGQVDEQVRFYAKTFGGTVFVTKDGEIVYALPSGRDVPAGASPSPSPSPSPQVHGRKGTEEQGCRGAWAANGYSPFLRADNADCPPERVLTNALLAAYLPGLQKETTQRVVSTSVPPASAVHGNEPLNNPHSAIQIPKSAIPNKGCRPQRDHRRRKDCWDNGQTARRYHGQLLHGQRSVEMEDERCYV